MKTKRNLIIFIIVTLASGWLGVLLDMVITEQPEGNSLGMGLWLIMPFLTTVALRIIGRDWNEIGLNPRFSKNAKWYGSALLTYPAVTIITIGLAMILGSVELSGFNSTLLTAMATAFFMGVAKNIFEEFAWRGYLTPKLIELRMNDWLIYIISGLVWALWHSAYYMVFLPDSYFGAISRVGMLLAGCVLMMCWAVMYAEIYRLTNSVWPCVLMHAVEDAVPTLLVTEANLTFSQGGDIILNPITGILATALFLVIGFALRAIRLKVRTNRTK